MTTRLHELLLDERLIGGGMIIGYDGDTCTAMPIASVEQYFDNWIVVEVPWQVTQNSPEEPWVFSDIDISFSFALELQTLSDQQDISTFRVVLEENSGVGFSVRYKSTSNHEPDVSGLYKAFFFAGHFPVEADAVEGFPKDLSKPSLSGWPRLELTDEEWLALIGHVEKEGYATAEDLEDNTMWALPPCCANISAVRELLTVIYHNDKYMTPAKILHLQQAITSMEDTHDMEFSAEIFDKIKAQL